MTKILLTGGSRGLGDQLSRLLPRSGDELILLSRTRPPSLDLGDGITRRHVPIDLSDPQAVGQLGQQISGSIDALIHNAGVWEPDAFTTRYRFANGDADDDQRIMQINLLTPLALTRGLLPHLRQSLNPKIILIGSVNGLENSGYPEAMYSVSKWGLRGMAHALREHLRSEEISITVINCGTLGDTLHDTAGKAVGQGIAWDDMVRIVRCVLDTSRRTVIKEIDVPAMLDATV